MSIKLPKNIIIESKYTQGNEYMFLTTYKKYQGYYYELNGKIFAGKEFDVFAPELIKLTSSNVNPLLINSATYIYGILSKNFKTISNSSKVNSIVKDNDPNLDSSGEETYYAKKINEIPYSIKQINKATYDNLQSDLFYKTTILNADQSNLEQAEKQIPGLKAFLGIE